MTEQEWLSSSDPAAMMRLLLSVKDDLSGTFRPSDRKLRLFACACCQAVSEELGKDAEQLVEWGKYPADNPTGWAMAWAGDQKIPSPVYRSALLRCLCGNPWRPVERWGLTGRGVDSFSYAPPWLTPTVRDLARAIYADRGWDDLPILADALEEAGCASADLLAHLRGPGVHARGCWALDLVLDVS